MTTAPVLDVRLTDDDTARALRDDVRLGFAARPRSLRPRWFYDARGSALFEEITRLPEYYPTRTERELLRRSAAAVAAASGADTLVELGSGSSEKTRLLLDALTARGGLRRYVPLDVSGSALRGAVDAVAQEYPGLAVHGVVADFTAAGLGSVLPAAEGRRLVAFLGGTLGNLLPAERAEFLGGLGAALRPGEHLLLGAGLVTDPQVLRRAYDDAAGVTAAFNRNVLRVLDRELGADFDEAAFDHVAVWDAEREWVEMRLRARRAMTVRLPAVGLEVRFEAGEELRTEVSAKFRPAGLAAELAAAGFAPVADWTDPDERFTLVLAALGR